ncbi:MAG: hypothetical protein R3E13_04040 [Alphaproteobacteria bacterium]
MSDSVFDADAGYRRADDIEQYELRDSLAKLALFSDDVFLTMQAANLSLIDEQLVVLEYEVLRELIELERTPPSTFYLSALTQMWIFSAYEILRTWRQRAKEVVKWAENGGLETKLEVLEQDLGYLHIGKQFRAKQIRKVIDDMSFVDRLKNDLRRIHVLFARIEALRVCIAKHEVAGCPNSVAYSPGYARICYECGSLRYELANNNYVYDYISRRDIADEMRNLWSDDKLMTDEEVAQFDDFIGGRAALNLKNTT